MEGKVIKEESSPSPASPQISNVIPSGKENRRTASPLNATNPSEILTRSRSKVRSKETTPHHHTHSHTPHPHRMTESPKTTPTTTTTAGPSSSGRSSPMPAAVKSSSSPPGQSQGHPFGHHFSSPSSTTVTGTSATAAAGVVNGRGIAGGGRTPSPSVILNGTPTTTTTSGGHSSGSSRTPSSNSNSSGSSREGLSMLSGPSPGRHVVKMKRFLGTLLHFGSDISPEVGDRVRNLVFNLVSGHLSVEEFHGSLQEVTSFPLRPFVLPFLRAHLPVLQREVTHLARISKQSPLTFIRGNESVFTESGNSPGEASDIFHSEAADVGIPGKRKILESFYDTPEEHTSSSGPYTSTPKRHHGGFGANVFSPSSSSSSYFISPGGSIGELREYGYPSYPLHALTTGHSHPSLAHAHHSESNPPPSNGVKPGPEDEWKNIHVMLNCILSMVEKTKRALSILQNRTFHGHVHSENESGGNPSPSSAGTGPWLRRPVNFGGGPVDNSEDFKRHAGEMMAQALRATEDRVAEVKRRAEEAVQEVKRQALAELQRAVAAAEARACETVASERARLERVFLDSRRNPGDAALLGPPVDPETCWNCGRKARETCSGCNMARYCSAFCQHKDWEHHHTACGRQSGSDRVATENKVPHPQDNHSPPLNVTAPSPPENISPRSPN